MLSHKIFQDTKKLQCTLCSVDISSLAVMGILGYCAKYSGILLHAVYSQQYSSIVLQAILGTKILDFLDVMRK